MPTSALEMEQEDAKGSAKFPGVPRGDLNSLRLLRLCGWRLLPEPVEIASLDAGTGGGGNGGPQFFTWKRLKFGRGCAACRAEGLLIFFFRQGPK